MADTAKRGNPAGEPAESGRLRAWLLQGLPGKNSQGPHIDTAPEKQHAWWQVMCLTGVDYFSSLGYAPGIAALAAGVLAPVATLILVAVTIFGALPIYRRVAQESPHGQGSIAMLEKLLPKWWGKFFVLALLGFAATDFIITMTLSAADATAHVLENSFIPSGLHGQQILVTLVLLALLGGVFLLGFSEAVRIAIGLVAVYLALNAVVAVVAVQHVITHAHKINDWGHLLTTEHSNPVIMVAVALLVFPKLALGMSGFETGVAVMPLIRCKDGSMRGRIVGARKLLTVAALIMSAFLLVSSFTTTVLIPQKAFKNGGPANGRALAYLAHEYLGNGFGTVYDISTIAILWFAGASAMAGLLNLVPRYLPRYGMAPHWTSATRPLVLVFTVIGFGITFLFDANVDAQGGAYATGVLVLMLSAAVAVTVSARRRGAKRSTIAFGVIAAVFAFTTIDNIITRPEGIQIASFFIIAIIVTSLVSRATRSTELRVSNIEFDDLARHFIDEEAIAGKFRVIANEPDERDEAEYVEKDAEQRLFHQLPSGDPVLFLEVTVPDASDFAGEVKVFNWAEGNPVVAMLRYLVFGGGDVAPLTREVIRQAEPDQAARPRVHVG